MMKVNEHISQLNNKGYSIIPNVYSESEIFEITKVIAEKELDSNSISKSKDLFAIRELVNEIPELARVLFNKNLRRLLVKLHQEGKLFLSKAIYFDKLEGSNWFVAYHQDLTINVIEQKQIEGFKNWTNKRGQIGVQPPTEYLDRTITIRIHLDDTDETNGALRVVPESHLNGVVRTEERSQNSKEFTCEVKSGGIMLMRPLTFHASSKASGHSNRRVIHLEFCDKPLPEELDWKERLEIV
ncbi:MAG: phytanoyl-CoA dioxygenase family protein [Maribacter sp.]|uniref:phytanoyl-CoA dioxygenase family protein n=1 Tax=Maribacter sp. TaxID=1897614 RepID=UPI003297EF3A